MTIAPSSPAGSELCLNESLISQAIILFPDLTVASDDYETRFTLRMPCLHPDWPTVAPLEVRFTVNIFSL